MTTMSSPPTAHADIAARIERLPHSLWHVKIRLLIGVVTFFEAFDQLLVAYTLPVIRVEWNLTPFLLTLAVTAGSVGMLVGALVAGWLADRIGRVRVVILAMVITAVASLFLAVSPGFEAFVALRFLQGVGIGGEVPVAAAYIGELSRAKGRGRFVLLYELVFPAGLLFAAVVSAWIVPNYGWRWLYLIGAAPGVLALILAKAVPESPRWLLARGDLPGAEKALSRIEHNVATSTGKALPEPVETEAHGRIEPKGSLRDLVTGKYLRRTVVVSALWFLGFVANYGITAWLPTIYTKVYGLPLSTALNYSLLATAAGFVGCLAVALLIDKLGRRACLFGAFGLSAAMLIVLASLGAVSGSQVAIWTTAAAVFLFAANISLYLYTPELYPTRVRALGASIGGAWSRVGVIVGPIVVGALVATGGTVAVFALLGGVAVLGAVFALFGDETSGRTLEELSA